MQQYESRSRITHQNGAMSRAKQLAVKSLVALGGIVLLAGAFVVSLAFFVMLFAVVLVVGGYLWWHTRELRSQLHERMRDLERSSPRSGGQIIEGEVVSRE